MTTESDQGGTDQGGTDQGRMRGRMREGEMRGGTGRRRKGGDCSCVSQGLPASPAFLGERVVIARAFRRAYPHPLRF